MWFGASRQWKTFRLTLFWVQVLLLLTGRNTTAAPVVVSDALASQPLTPLLEQFEDRSRQVTIEDVTRGTLNFVPTNADTLNLGYTSSAYWFRLRLRNDTAQTMERLLEVEQPYLSRVEAYLPGSNAPAGAFIRFEAGDALPFNVRVIPHRLPVFPVAVPPHTEQLVYLRVETRGSLTFSATLWKPLDHARKDRIHSFFLGVYYGLLLILVIYNAVFFLGIQDRANIYFSAYLLSLGLFQACVDGFATQLQNWLLGGFVVEGFVPRLALANLVSATAALLTRKYLLLEVHSPLVNRALGALAAVFFTLAVLSVVTPTRFVAQIANSSMLLGGIFGLLSAFVPLRQGYRPALYFLVAWSVVVLAVVLNTLRTAGLIPQAIAWHSVLHFGTAAQGLLISVGLLARLMMLQQEKEAARAEADLRAAEVAISVNFNEQLKKANQELSEALAAREEARREAEQRRAEAEAANGRLMELDRLKSEFTAMLVHDLRSPLAAVNGTLELIEETLSDPDLLELVRASQSNVRRTLDLITDLLELSRSESQSLTLDLKLLDLVPILRQCVENTRLGAANALDFVADLPPTLPAVAGDARKLERVFMNLLTNAAKFTPSGGTITVSAREVAGEGVEAGLSFVEISVTDTGVGIPAAELPFLFDPYRQGGQGKKKVGFGLGLAIAKRIVAAHDGNITVKSQVGVGSTFTITLPCWASRVGQTSLDTPSPSTTGDSGETALTSSDGARAAKR
ncbi:MAG: sensor histidine kinase [Chloracidobacterium sp.]|nr:sensor histidine kinase [Chloracidobacterium sp.]MDW8218246.1 sensor histidine kinase [Acidobacteriota bacterium]